MKFEIKSRWTGTVLFSIETDTWKLAVEAAVKARADLSRADLSRADLSGADLSGVNLYGADLSGANLYGAYLYGADLSGADLSGVNLYGADLSGANLSGAYLYGADLSGANLSGVNLSRADLSGANLYGANLSGANLSGVNLSRADLSGVKNADLAAAQTLIVPADGPIYGWKKCRNGVLVKLAVGAKARRSNASGRKCRAEYVKVLEVIGAEEGISLRDGETKYRVGQIVRCNVWDDNRWNECSGGIHFFLTKEEAMAWEPC